MLDGWVNGWLGGWIGDLKGRENLRGNSDTEGSGFFETEVVWDLDLVITLYGDDVCESSIVVVDLVSSVGETAYAITLLEVLGNCTSNLFNDTCVVTSDL